MSDQATCEHRRLINTVRIKTPPNNAAARVVTIRLTCRDCGQHFTPLSGTVRPAMAITGGTKPAIPPEPKGVGDVVEKALSAIGITKERVEAFVGAPCGCAERRAKLNRLGFWAASVLSGAVEGAKESLESILSGTRR